MDFDKIKEAIKYLTDEQREEIHNSICSGCGTLADCCCWNDD